ncbi:exonuclease domain-containing protein [Candidatus Poriferisodalis sp.]|uniref:exonuclease domain-containing protein n=1 Tax=Candidatus Poriferisodalis sp. TaxID=3101277 RepID=UPI003C705085
MGSPDWTQFADVASVDVETATASEASICQVGVATVDGRGQITVNTWLVQPPGNRYEAKNIGIHGITPEETADEPTFDVIWPEVCAVLGQRQLIAHNSEFDRQCLAATLRLYGIVWKQPRWGCTLRMAHLLLPRRTQPYRLTALCESYGVHRGKQHDAGDDAAAALQLAALPLAADGDGDLKRLIDRSNRGWQSRRETANRRVASMSTDPATERQLAYLSDLLAERAYPCR